MNAFDYFIKENLHIRYYIRYCDDFVVFGNSKKELNTVKLQIRDYLLSLRLYLHKNKSRIFNVTDSVDFLGYRIYPEYTIARKTVVKRYRKKLQTMIK